MQTYLPNFFLLFTLSPLPHPLSPSPPPSSPYLPPHLLLPPQVTRLLPSLARTNQMDNDTLATIRLDNMVASLWFGLLVSHVTLLGSC